MAGNDEIKELFSKSFENFEKPVDPGLWDKIQSDLNSPSGSGTGDGGSGIAAKTGWIKTVIIGSVSVAAITTGILLYVNSENSKSEESTTEINEPITEQNDIEKELPKEEFLVIENNDKIVDEIDRSDDPAIMEKKEEIKQKVISDINENTSINTAEIDDLLDQNLLDELSKKEEPKVIDQKENKVDENQNKASIDDPKIEKDPKIDHNTFEKEQEPEKTEAEIYMENIPNVITPNGDRINDFIEFKHKDIKEFEIQILNAAGSKLVFKDRGHELNYAGLDLGGDHLDEGNYRMVLIAIDNNGKKIVNKSFLYIRK